MKFCSFIVPVLYIPVVYYFGCYSGDRFEVFLFHGIMLSFTFRLPVVNYTLYAVRGLNMLEICTR